MALEDILDPDLAENNRRIIVTKLYEGTFIRDTEILPRTQTPKKAIYTFRDIYALFNRAIAHYDERSNIATEHKIFFTEEYPPTKSKDISKDPTRIVSVSCVKRLPGMFGRGNPSEAAATGAGVIRNRKPRLREEMDDPENPGYRLAILGYYYDCIIRFICWARSNVEANKLVDRFSDMMLEYDWWFKAEGIDRVIFEEQQQDVFLNADDNKWYGRPLDYFVRTEKIKILSEKSIEEIYLNLTLASD